MLEERSCVAGRYTIVGTLGRGGMGAVYRAFDEELGREVALKVLLPRHVATAKARARLLREARAAAAVRHPSVVKVLDAGELADGGAFLVMELVVGRSLREVAEARELDRDRTAAIISAAASGLGALHARGLVHRDIKPDNIMLCEDGRVVVVDLGLVKSIESDEATTREELTRSGMVLGTPAYLPPEQARGRNVVSATDQFALAVTAYELVTGRRPWVADSPTQMLALILMDDPPPPSSIVGDLPEALDLVLSRALAKKPEDRFATVEQFGEAFACAITGRSVDVAPPPAAPVPSADERQSRRARRSIAIGSAVAMAALVVATLVWRPPEGSPAERSPQVPSPFVAAGDAILACPILDARGVDPPTGWLGAAAASLVCSRIGASLGAERVREPAELLGLPTVASEELPADAWAASDARERTLSSARASAAGFIDGEVVRAEDGGFAVALVLKSDRGDVARGSATDGSLIAAVEGAIGELVDAGALPPVASAAADDRRDGEQVYSDPRVAAAWKPESSAAWRDLGLADRDRPTDALEWLRRALALGQERPVDTVRLGSALLLLDQHEEARSLAALHLAGDGDHRVAGAHLQARVAAEEGRIAHALRLLLDTMSELERFGDEDRGDPDLLRSMLSLAETLGSPADGALPFIDRFVLGSSPRLTNTERFSCLYVSACLAAPRPTAGRCLDVLGGLAPDATGEAGSCVEGARHALRGDDRGAVDAWRSLVDSPIASDLPAAVFDRAGEVDLASRIDADRLTGPIGPAHAREARRALQRGDTDRARALARAFVDAWGVADARVPSVDDMHTLLREARE